MFPTDVNFLAVLVAGIAYFMIGGLWYSVLFGKAWLTAIGKTEEEVRNEGGAPVAYVVSFIGSLISAYFLAVFMSGTTLQAGLGIGFFVWMGFVATTNATTVFLREPKQEALPHLWRIHFGKLSGHGRDPGALAVR